MRTRYRAEFLAAACVLAAAQAVGILVGPGSIGHWMAVYLPTAIPLVAAAACFAASRGVPERERLFWSLLGLGAFAWALGEVGWDLYAALGFDPTGLSFADAGYLALIPIWAAAFIFHPARSQRAADRLGSTIDALAIFSVVATVTAVYVIVPYARGAPDMGSIVVNTAYPVGDLVLLAVIFSTFSRYGGVGRGGDILVWAAALALAAGDIVYARLIIVGAYAHAHPVDLTWTAAFVLVILAAGRGLHGQEHPDETRRVSVLTIVAIVGIGVLAMMAAVTARSEAVLLYGAIVASLLLVSRMMILLRDRARLVDKLDVKIDELENAHAARERFIATVSHDLRSPLTSISGFAELLTDPDTAEDPRQVAEMSASIKRNARRLARLTEDLLCAGQFATGHPPPLRLEAVDLRHAVDEVIADTGREGKVRVFGRWTYAMADKQRVQQVLMNLLDNAFKHSGSSEVSVNIRQLDEGAILDVSDGGVGIAPDRLRNVFEPFVSGSTTTSSVGLGLYVVNGLVTAMGGRVRVSSELGHGTSFQVTLPAAVPASALVGADAPLSHPLG